MAKKPSEKQINKEFQELLESIARRHGITVGQLEQRLGKHNKSEREAKN